MIENVYTVRYTGHVAAAAFEWDEANVENIARHRFTPEEVEEIFEGPRKVRRGRVPDATAAVDRRGNPAGSETPSLGSCLRSSMHNSAALLAPSRPLSFRALRLTLRAGSARNLL